MVEYGLILALVSIVAIGSLTGIGGKVNDAFNKVTGGLGGEVVDSGDAALSEIDRKISEEGYIPVANSDELNYLREDKSQVFGKGTKWEGEYTSGLDKKYIQVSDIDLGGITNFEPIGKDGAPFKGYFDGDGNTISNLKIDKEDNNVGLFGKIEGSTLTNIGLVNVNVKGSGSAGGLVGYSDSSTINNSYSTGSVKGVSLDDMQKNGSNIGGLVGEIWGNSSVENSYSTCDVYGGANHVGGLIGRGSGSSIKNSYSTGSVTGNSPHGYHGYGGLLGTVAGRNSVTIEESGWANDVGSVSENEYGTGKLKSELDSIISNLIK